jgi:type I restriction enzyme, S subunit
MVDKSNNNKLSKGWVSVRMGDIVINITKGSTPTSYGFSYKNTGISFIKTENIDNIGNIENITDYIDEETNIFLKRSILQTNDLLFSIAGTIGRVGVVRENNLPANTNQALGIIRCSWEHIQNKYVFYFLKSPFIQRQALNAIVGVGRANVSLTNLSEFEIPLPPLPEQHRIVAKIEELFSDIDDGIASLKKAQGQLKTYRQAVLKYAFEGKLTNKNVKDGELPEGWKWLKLGDVIENMQYGTSDKSNDKAADIPVIRMGNIQDGKLDFNNLKYFYKTYPEVDKYLLDDGDVLFNRTNSAELVGKSAIYKKQYPRAIFASYLIRIKVKKKSLNPNFLNYYINSIFGKNYIKSVVSQNVGQANVNGTKLKGLPIPVSSLQEQSLIVQEIEVRLSDCDNMEKTIEQSLLQAELLKQSVLKKAFEGKLVPQNPDDEPAEKLLERIKTEKAKIEAEQKVVKKKVNRLRAGHA